MAYVTDQIESLKKKYADYLSTGPQNQSPGNVGASQFGYKETLGRSATPQELGGYEGVAFNNAPGEKVTRFVNPTTNKHFYTSSEAEAESVRKSGLWKEEGVAWTNDAASAGKNVYRLVNPATGDHFYTINEAEANIAKTSGGYKDEGVGWKLGEQNPIYRFNLPGGQGHFYTANAGEASSVSGDSAPKIQSIFGSDEYKNRYINQQYQGNLYRSATPTELSTGLGQLNTGTTYEGLKSSIMSSPEYATVNRPAFGNQATMGGSIGYEPTAQAKLTRLRGIR